MATLSGLVTPFTASSVNVALAQIQNEFHIDAIMLAWVQTSYLLATPMFLLELAGEGPHRVLDRIVSAKHLPHACSLEGSFSKSWPDDGSDPMESTRSSNEAVMNAEKSTVITEVSYRVDPKPWRLK